MSLPDDNAPRSSDPTTVDSASPFDSTGQKAAPRGTQLTSDPPTTLVRRDNFRELPPGSVVGEIYEIDARLGAGAMGEVYAARHMKLGKRVAIKVISQRLSEDAAAIERFAMEAKALAQIQHPAIVAVDHVGELADGRAYFVMEFLLGETLFDRISRGRIPFRDALRILDQMSRGLEAAHVQGIVHRDLKPENVFLVRVPGEAPIVKLLDFGLAKLRRTDDARAERTQSGVAIGTPMYMSPEQARGPDVDHRTDIYALGCIAYELLLGRSPFPHARTAPEFYAAHLHETPPPPRSIWPEVPLELDQVLFAMLAKDPARRPTLEWIRAVIANAQAAAAAQHAATEFVGTRAKKPKRRIFAVATLAALVALVGGITIGTGVGRRESAAPVTAPRDPPPDVAPTQATRLVAPRDVPQVDAALIDDDPPPAPRTRRRNGSSRSNATRQTPKVTVPVDTSVDATAIAPQTPLAPAPPNKPVDRNQTINPFAKKRPR